MSVRVAISTAAPAPGGVINVAVILIVNDSRVWPVIGRYPGTHCLHEIQGHRHSGSQIQLDHIRARYEIRNLVSTLVPFDVERIGVRTAGDHAGQKICRDSAGRACKGKCVTINFRALAAV